jgi:hypothetical protein
MQMTEQVTPETPTPEPAPKAKAKAAAKTTSTEPEVGSKITADGVDKTYHGGGIFSLDY